MRVPVVWRETLHLHIMPLHVLNESKVEEMVASQRSKISSMSLIDHFCSFWPSPDWPFLRDNPAVVLNTFNTLFQLDYSLVVWGYWLD